MDSNKTPGTDGLPTEFYKIFWKDISTLLRLVFTSDGAVVRVAIRRVEGYDPVKIKPTESEAEH